MKHLRASSLASLVLSLELKERADLAKGRVGPQHGDEGHLFLKLLTEADEKSVYEDAVVDVITKLPEFITDRLDPLTEDGDQEVIWIFCETKNMQQTGTGTGHWINMLVQ